MELDFFINPPDLLHSHQQQQEQQHQLDTGEY